MSDKITVLVVDDDQIQRLLIVDALSESFSVLEADGGEQALALVAQQRPLVVLLDICMPGMDGYQLCQALKDRPELAHVPVLFISNQPGLEERLAAYAAGGVDFIAKPIEPAELRSKVAVLAQQLIEREQLDRNVQDAFGTAMSAMSSASEMGVVLNGLRGCFACQDYPALASLLLEACQSFGLQACVRLAGLGGLYKQNQHGEVNAVEAGALDMLSEGERIFSFGRQSAFHFGGVTLLIRNMPVDDVERCGRLRDHLAMLAEGGEARRHAIDNEQALRSLFDQVVHELQQIEQQYGTQCSSTELTLQDMLNQVEASFVVLGLTAGQEERVAELLRRTAAAVSSIYREGLHLPEHLARLRAAFGGVSGGSQA